LTVFWDETASGFVDTHGVTLQHTEMLISHIHEYINTHGEMSMFEIRVNRKL